MPVIDPRFRHEFQEVMSRNGVWDPRGLMELPDGAQDTYEEVPVYAVLREVDFLGSLPVAEQNAVLIRAAAAHLAVILEHAAGREDYFCAVTVDFWDEFDDGGLVTPRFLYANPAREFFQNVRLLPGTSRYSRFTEECLASADYVVNDQPSPARADAAVEAVWVQHVSCRVPPEVVGAG